LFPFGVKVTYRPYAADEISTINKMDGGEVGFGVRQEYMVYVPEEGILI